MKPSYVKEFESLFVPTKIDLLKQRALNGKFRQSRFRSISWRYFLKCLPANYDDWLDACKQSRQQYDQIKAKYEPFLFSTNEEEQQQSSNNCNGSPSKLLMPIKKNVPDKLLSSSLPSPSPPTIYKLETLGVKVSRTPSSSPEVQASDAICESSANLDSDSDNISQSSSHKDEQTCDYKNLNNVIRRDVIRTFPDMDFFRATDIQSILANVLFNYASEHTHLSYKQGMHELLATLLFVLHTDSQNCTIHHSGGYANETIATLLDINYLEHDVYHIFCALMKTIEAWYQNDEIILDPTGKRRIGQVTSVLSFKLNLISEKIVKRHDPELFNHLDALQISFQLFGIRWMRLLFGREYEFLDLLVIWDALICDTESLGLTDYLFASMLITIREKLVNGDYTDCLNNLMRHQFKDVNHVIKLALYLKNPSSLSARSFVATSAVPVNRNPRPLVKPIQNSYKSDDLRSIVDYSWRLLSEQIESMQKCLSKEKNLHFEDDIFIALAQIKKVRDVLKGSLKLDDELATLKPPSASTSSSSNSYRYSNLSRLPNT